MDNEKTTPPQKKNTHNSKESFNPEGNFQTEKKNVFTAFYWHSFQVYI